MSSYITPTSETRGRLLSSDAALGGNDLSSLGIGAGHTGGAGSEDNVGELHLD